MTVSNMFIAKSKQPEYSSAVAQQSPPNEQIQVSNLGRWVDLVLDPTATDNSTNAVLNPKALTRKGLGILVNEGHGTFLDIRLKYPAGTTVSTSPVVEPFGFDSINMNDPAIAGTTNQLGQPEALYDATATPSHDLTLTATPSTDVTDGVYLYTPTQTVDMNCNVAIMLPVKTAYAATGGAGGNITAATNAAPIVITSTAHGLTTGQYVKVASVGGNTAANGNWFVTVIDANTFQLNGTVGNGAYTSGGTWVLLGAVQVRVKSSR